MRPKFLLFYTGLFLAGALFPLSLAPFSYWLIAIASLAVLFASLTGQTAKELFKRAATFGFGMFGTGVSWVFISMHSFGDVSFFTRPDWYPFILFSECRFFCAAFYALYIDTNKEGCMACRITCNMGYQRME